MKETSPRNSERIVSLVLQVGVAVSSVCILFGLVLFFSKLDTSSNLTFQRFTSPSFLFPHRISTLASSLATGQGIGYITLGVLFLILTPVLRVATSILLFMRQRDYPMTIVTFFVLLILVGSFILGIFVG